MTSSEQHISVTKGGSRGGRGPPPVVSVCNIFCTWLLAFRHTTQLASKRFVNRIAEGVGITPPLPNLGSATLQLHTCNPTLTLDSRYNGRHALAWEYQRWHLKQHASSSPQHLAQLSQLTAAVCLTAASQLPGHSRDGARDPAAPPAPSGAATECKLPSLELGS